MIRLKDPILVSFNSLVLSIFQVAGYVTTYNVNSFKFVTVKGAGHMVTKEAVYTRSFTLF